MKFPLNPNERLIYVGKTNLRAPDGTPLENVPQYMIVPAHKADAASVRPLRDNERLILAGTLHSRREASERRYAEALAGRVNPCADGTPIYIKEAIQNIDEKSGLSTGEKKTCDELVGDLVDAYAMVVRRTEAEAAQVVEGRF